MTKLRDVLQAKGGSIISIAPFISVYDALLKMVEKDIGALLVLDNEGKLLGLFTERDYSRKVVLKGKSSKETLVREIMVDNPVTISLEESIPMCVKTMTDNAVRYLPVMSGENLTGLISLGDVLRHTNAEQGDRIKSLEDYITN